CRWTGVNPRRQSPKKLARTARAWLLQRRPGLRQIQSLLREKTRFPVPLRIQSTLHAAEKTRSRKTTISMRWK
ncbi:unnamed protein product, partial [Symbiodinium sp. CCMP2456]